MKGSHKANCKVHESQRQKNFSEHTWPKCCFPKSGASRSSKTCLGPQSAVTFMSFHSDWGLLSLQDKEQAWTLSWCEKTPKNICSHIYAYGKSIQECDILCWWRLYSLKFNLHKDRKLTCWSLAGFLNWNTSQICNHTESVTMNHTSQVIDGCGCILSWGLKLRPMICRQIRIQAQVCHLKTQQPVCWQQTLQQPLASNCNIYVKRRKKSNQTNHESWVTSKLLTHCLELDSRVASVQRFTTGKFVQSWHVGFIVLHWDAKLDVVALFGSSISIDQVLCHGQTSLSNGSDMEIFGIYKWDQMDTFGMILKVSKDVHMDLTSSRNTWHTFWHHIHAAKNSSRCRCAGHKDTGL